MVKFLTCTLICTPVTLHAPLTTSLISSTVEFDNKPILMELTIFKQPLHFRSFRWFGPKWNWYPFLGVGWILLGPGRNSKKCMIFLLSFKINSIGYVLYVLCLMFFLWKLPTKATCLLLGYLPIRNLVN